MKINKYIVLILLLSAVIVTLATYHSLSNSNLSAGLAGKVYVSEHQIARVERIYSLVSNADEGVKNYIITGDEKLLVPYDSSAAKINRSLKYLKNDLTGDSTLLPEVDLLSAYANTKLLFIDTLARVRKYSLDSARQMVLSVKGITLMDSIKSLVARINMNERQMRSKYTGQDELSLKNTTRTIILGGILAFLIILLVLIMLERDMRKRMAAEKLLRESEIRYRTIAQNVGSFIYTCDYYGKVTFVTPNITALTGYEPNDIIGKHFTFMVAAKYVDDLKKSYYEQFKNKIKEKSSEFELVTRDGILKKVIQDVVIFSTEDMMMGFQCVIHEK